MASETNQFILSVLDTAGIQPYIFGSNNLQQNVGASGLVHEVTHEAAYVSLIDVCDGSVNIDKSGTIDPTKRIEEGTVKAELIYSGGGNTVILFQDRELAVEFTRNLSRKSLGNAPGLQLVVAHINFRWNPEDPPKGDSLATGVKAAIREVNRKKRDRQQWSAPLMGLSVTADCQFTGAPAVVERPRSSQSDRLQRLSGESLAKKRFFNDADQRMKNIVSHELGKFEFAYNFDDFGTKGESSFMAVVHIDGNGMGNRVKAIAETYRMSFQNRAYIEAMRAFSDSIEDASDRALRRTVSSLTDSLNEGKIAGKVGPIYNKQNNTLSLPFRPIVLGGDDITFVCDGRLALSLTELYLHHLQEEKLDDRERLYVRAGVAIVKSHYPFSRAYELAEDLADEAKGRIKALSPDDAPYARLSAIDWHFAVSGLVRTIPEIRNREYRYQQDGDLCMRPLLLEEPADRSEWRTMPEFKRVLHAFSTEPWKDKHNQQKALREILREGPDTVRHFLHAFGESHFVPPKQQPALGNDQISRETGWVNGRRCAWFDALEVIDLHVLWEPLSIDDTLRNGGNQ